MSSSFREKRTTLQMLFFGGLLVLLPPALAFFAGRLVYNLVEDYIGGPVAALMRYILPHDWLHGILRDGHIPGLSLVITVATICIVGLVARYQLGQLGLKLVHMIFERIPGIRVVYTGARKLVESLADPAKKSWKKVVFFPGPFPNSQAFGFLTGEFIDSESGEKYAAVAIMHAPLPTSGFIVWIKLSELVESDLTVEQALHLGGSMGVVAPPSFKITGVTKPDATKPAAIDEKPSGDAGNGS